MIRVKGKPAILPAILTSQRDVCSSGTHHLHTSWEYSPQPIQQLPEPVSRTIPCPHWDQRAQQQRVPATPPTQGFKEDLAIQLFFKQAISTAIWNSHSFLHLHWAAKPNPAKGQGRAWKILLLQIIHKQPLSLCA